MSSNWAEFILTVQQHLHTLASRGCSDPFFRGHSDSSWKLLPGLARVPRVPRLDILENRLYGKFWYLGGHLLPFNLPTWDVLFLMQHHGLPTRLLDWSESFAVALYFATREAKEGKEAAVWVIDPYNLNQLSNNISQIEELNAAFSEGYDKIFADGVPPYAGFPPSILAVYNRRLSSRMQWQRAVFTIHRELEKPLEELYPTCTKKFVIPTDALGDARNFLLLSGINEFSAFPDLDGLARHIKECELS
jgi:hypothetical protein